jgi:hypothetical protein
MPRLLSLNKTFYLIFNRSGFADIGLCSSDGCVQSEYGRHHRDSGHPT